MPRVPALTTVPGSMRVAWVALLLVTLPALANAGISDEVTQRINQDVRTVLQRTETPGATMLVSRDGLVIYRKAIGLRDFDRKLLARVVAMRASADEDVSVTSKAAAAFEALERGEDNGSVFSASLKAKLKAGLAQKMARQFESYGTATALVFKGRQVIEDKHWFDYLMEFGPGNTFKFSVAMDDEGKVTSVGFNRF